jgi:serine/threonine protein kinase/WD40 repeat protein
MDNPNRNEKALFTAARELTDPIQRQAFLDQACDGDPKLRQRLEEMLGSKTEAEQFFAAGTMKLELEATARFLVTEKSGDRIGRYKLLEKIGEGGCGVVYVAEQEEPVRRRVALKVIKLGMDTRSVVARFEAERQALAMMDHPNIAKVLDAGATETGRPYFVMELVRGIKLTDYCDQNKLTAHTRLGLFIQICQAVQHAHQKGIIHRDLKPSNILVTLHDGVPVPKVIDFGIAKATEGRLTDLTVYTELNQFIGTPAYMSPEQAEMSGLDIDTRSDIYSLGVLLYELLTGTTPFDAKELLASGLDAMRRTIREKDPLRPSTKLNTLSGKELTTTAQRRGVDVPKLVHLVRGDLDWIVMKCLEKDRTRRYETANGLGADLKRFLQNEPVVARPPSQLYRFERMVQRNRVLFAASSAVIVALLSAVVISTWLAHRAMQAEKEQAVARAAADRARANEETQRLKAETNAQSARQAQATAEAEELLARRRAYASDINLAQQALLHNNLGRARELLDRHRPSTGIKGPDLRGWEWRYLWQKSKSEALFTLCKEPDEICALSASPDGRWVAIGERTSGHLVVWDLQRRQRVAIMQGSNFQAQGPKAVFSPTGLLAYSGYTASNQIPAVFLWDPETQTNRSVLLLDAECRGMAFGKDGSRLLTIGAKEDLVLWDVAEARKLETYRLPVNVLLGVPFAATTDLSVVAVCAGSKLRVFDRALGKQLWETNAPEDYFTALSFSPNGHVLATGPGFLSGPVRLWDATSGRELCKLEGHQAWVSHLLFDSKGRWLASASADHTIRIWDVEDPTRAQVVRVLRGHQNEVWHLGLLPDGKTLISGSKDGEVSLWDVHSKAPEYWEGEVPAKDVFDWHFFTNSSSVLTLRGGSGLQLWEWHGPGLQEGSEVMQFDPAALNRLCFSGDGHLAAASYTNQEVEVWQLLSRPLLLKKFKLSEPGLEAGMFDDHNGRLLLHWNNSKPRVEVWDIASPTCSRILAMDMAPDSQRFDSSADLNWMVNCTTNGIALLVDLAHGTSKQLGPIGRQLSECTISPDGQLVAVGSYEGTIRVWNLRTGETSKLRGFLNSATSVVFSPDNKRLVVASSEQEAIKIWDTDAWLELLTLSGKGTLFTWAYFSPDGNALGVMNRSHSVEFWRAPSWEEIQAEEQAKVAVVK